MSGDSDKNTLGLVRAHTLANLRKALVWLAGQQNGGINKGWPSSPELPPDELSTVESLLYLESGKQRIPGLARDLVYNLMEAIDFVYRSSVENGYVYWVRRSHDGATAPSPYYTGKILFDLMLIGEQPENLKIRKALDWLKKVRFEDGWEFTLGESMSSPIAVANVLLAESMSNDPDSREMINKAKSLLEKVQTDNDRIYGIPGWGGKSSDVPNLGATAVVVRALSELECNQTQSSILARDYIKKSLIDYDGNSKYYPDITPERKHVRNTAWCIVSLLLSGEKPTSPYVVPALQWLVENQDHLHGGWSAAGFEGFSTVRDTHDGIACMLVFLKCIDFLIKTSNAKDWRFSEMIRPQPVT